jgi:hypothetical protein
MPIKLTRKYPRKIRLRYSKTPEAASSPTADIDPAMREPIKIMNQKLGYETFGCCEGHKDPVNPYQKKFKVPKGVRMIKGKPYDSYIGFYLPITYHLPLIDFLIKRKFFAAPAYIAGGSIYVSNNITGYNANFYQRYRDGVGLVYGTDGAMKGDRFGVTIQVLPIQMPKSQKQWDELRDTGWETWLNLLQKFNKSMNTVFVR